MGDFDDAMLLIVLSRIEIRFEQLVKKLGDTFNRT